MTRAVIQVPLTDNADMTLEELYKDLHSHPELAFAEHRTAGIAAEWLAGAGEASASGASRQPACTVLASFPVTVNDDALTARLAAALDRTREIDQRMGSEDFGFFGTVAGAPSVFWGLGCAADGAPGTYSPRFAPQIQPTLAAGVNALVTAVRVVLPAA